MRERKVIREGKSICDSCGRVVPSGEVYRQGFTYWEKFCPQEGKNFSRLLNRGRWYPSPRPLSFAPHFRVKLGSIFKGELDKVENIERIETFVLRITDLCDAGCQVCVDYHKIGGKEPGIRELSRMELFSHRHIALTGGEPTLREDLEEIIRYLKKKRNFVSICTNGLRLAEEERVRRLKESGLDQVLLSFDGFQEKSYEMLWGGRKNLYLKLKALDNLKKISLPVILQVTLVKGINFSEIGKILELAREDFIGGVWFKPLHLYTNPGSNFNLAHLPTLKEIRKEIIRKTGIEEDYFDILYEFKLHMLNLREEIFPGLPLSQPQSNQLFLDKNLSPLLNREELLSFKKGNIFKGKSWLRILMKRGLSYLGLEKELLKKTVRVVIGRSRSPYEINLDFPLPYLYLSYSQDKGWRFPLSPTHITPMD